MGAIKTLGRYAWRKWSVDGVEATGANKPATEAIFPFVDAVDGEVAGLNQRVTDVDTALGTRLTAVEQLALSGVRPAKQSVRLLVTTATAPASMTAGATLDGLVLVANDRVARATSAGAIADGVYVVQASGAAIRSTDMDSEADVIGARFDVDAGTHASETWTLSNLAPISVDLTVLIFVKSGSANATTAEVLAARDGKASIGARMDDFTAALPFAFTPFTEYDSDLTGYIEADVDDDYRIRSGITAEGDRVSYGPIVAPQSAVVTSDLTLEDGGDPELSGFISAEVDVGYRLIEGIDRRLAKRLARPAFWGGMTFSTNYRVEVRFGNLIATHLTTGNSFALTSSYSDRKPQILGDESAVLFERDIGFGEWVLYRVALSEGSTPARMFPSLNIAGWGDSMTQNQTHFPWVDQLAPTGSLNRCTVNYGVSGETSLQIKNRMVADTLHRDWTTIIEVGRNDILTTGSAAILANIALMVAHLTPYSRRFLICSVFNNSNEPSGNANYTTVMNHNAAVAAAYTSNYVDVRTWMVNSALAYLGLTPTANDLTDIGNDVVPRQLRNAGDTLHHNQLGANAWAHFIETDILNRGW
ncbi:hypothetical protein NKJ09_22665 [Mesorhizobium sp. M0189]|uniref:SGNH/GDSL hydrolase family protein n=1 Tax=Mesorhizobium sp. M0189 TaxID=2956909 RepID=UPI0033366910